MLLCVTCSEKLAQAKEDNRQDESDEDDNKYTRKELLLELKGLRVEMSAREEAEKKVRSGMLEEMEQTREQVKQQMTRCVLLYMLL